MFCKNCGNAIPDGAAFCVFCGTKQALTTSQNQNVVSTETKEKPLSWSAEFRQSWRNLVATPWFIAMAVCVTLFYVIMACISWALRGRADDLGAVSEILKLIDQDSATGTVQFFGGLLNLTPYALIACCILTVVGLWMTYADSKSSDVIPIKTTGLKMIIVGKWCGIIGSALFVASLYFFIQSVLAIYEGDELLGGMGLSDYFREKVEDQLWSAAIPWIIVMVYNIIALGVVRKLRDTAETEYPQISGGLTVIAVIFFVIAALLLLVNMIGMCLLPSAIGVFIIMCRKETDTLISSYYQRKRDSDF